MTLSNFQQLNCIALFALIFGSMMGSGVFDIPQNLAYGSTLFAILIGWVITITGVLALAWVFVYITNRRPDIKNGLYGYASQGFGKYIGFNSAWGYAINALLANISYLIYIFAILGNFIFLDIFKSGTTIYAMLAESILVWIIYYVIRLGIKEASYINIIITLVKLIALILIIAIFIFNFKYSHFKSNMHAAYDINLLQQVKNTMLITVWGFTGIEAACVFALSAKSLRDITRATFLGIIFACVVDVLISILPFGMMPGSIISTLLTPSTANILTMICGVYIGDMVRIIVVISVMGALLTWTMLATNMFYLAAQDHALPKILLRTNQRNVPTNCLLLNTTITQIFIIVAYFAHAAYLVMIQFATSLIILPYLLSALFAMKISIKDNMSYIKGIIAVVYCVWLVYSGGIHFLLLSSSIYLLGSVLYIISCKEYRRPLFISKAEVIVFIVLVMSTLALFIS